MHFLGYLVNSPVKIIINIQAQSRQSARLFLQSSELGPSIPQASVSPGNQEGGGHTRLLERGWGSQFGRGDRLCGSRYICSLCIHARINITIDDS